MIDSILDEVEHIAKHHPTKLESALEIIRTAMNMSAKASALKTFMLDELPHMIDDCGHEDYDDGHEHGPGCNH